MGQYPGTPFQGERKVCFRSPKMYQNSPAVTEMQNSKIFRGTKPRTFVRFRGKFVFVLQKCTETPTAMQNSNIFPETILRTPVLGWKKVCFRSPEMYQTSPTAMQNSKFSGGQYPGPPF